MDLWSLNHFLSGVVFIGWLSISGVDTPLLFAIYLVITIGWEVYESLRGIHEYKANKIFDVVTGVLGFLVAYTWVPGMSLLIVLTVLYFALEIHGYLTYRRGT